MPVRIVDILVNLMNWTEIYDCLMLPPALHALMHEFGLVKQLLSNTQIILV